MNIEITTLSQANIQDIHQKSIDLLTEHGITLEHQGAIDILTQAGATASGHKVKFTREMIESSIKSAPKSFDLFSPSANNFITIGKKDICNIGPAAGVVAISDAKGRRGVSFDDMENFLKLVQSSEVCSFASAGMLYPITNDSTAAIKKQILMTLQYTDKPLLGLTQNENISKMSIEALAPFSNNHEHYILGVVNSLSPLKWDGNMLGSIIEFAKANQPIIVACCSMAGCTSPISLIDTVLLNNIELLAGIVLFQCVRPGAPVIYGNTSAITDMATMGLAIGAPEYAIINNCASQMASYYQMPFRGGGGLNDAKILDAQCGAESAINLLLGINSNLHIMLHGLGVMESFMAINYEKWIFDEQIVKNIQRIKRPIGEISENIVELAAQKGEGGTYITDDETLDCYQDEFEMPLIFDRLPYDSWHNKNKDLKATCNAIFQKRIASYKAPQAGNSLIKEIQKILDKF